jgi:hypothetical protein
LSLDIPPEIKITVTVPSGVLDALARETKWRQGSWDRLAHFGFTRQRRAEAKAMWQFWADIHQTLRDVCR